MDTKEFKTKTTLLQRQNPTVSGHWGIAIDVGYSAVKIYSPNMLASFPSYVKEKEYGAADKLIGTPRKEFIAYRDEDGNEYFVGDVVQNNVSVTSADSSTASMYVRNRYSSKEFKVIARVGLALGMMKNNYGDPKGKELHVITGLPSEYMKRDSESIIRAFEGAHHFSLKLASSKWIDFDFELSRDNIEIIPQPLGTLTSIVAEKNGSLAVDAKTIMSSNVLIFDPGFGTLDTFSLVDHVWEDAKTWANLGMHRVLQETATDIYTQYGEDIPIPAMQKLLGKGVFEMAIDEDGFQTKEIAFGDILEAASKRVCEEALDTVHRYYNSLKNFDYLIVTGGTGAAWFDYIREKYEGSRVKVVSGTMNDTVPGIFSNVRGYYMSMYHKLRANK